MLPGCFPHGAWNSAWARSSGSAVGPQQSSGSPADGAGAGVRAADGWGSPPQFRDRPVCGKQQFSGPKSTLVSSCGSQSCLSPVPEEPEQPLERARREADGAICTGETARPPGRELSTPGASTALGHSRSGRGSRMPVPSPSRHLPAPRQGRDTPGGTAPTEPRGGTSGARSPGLQPRQL